MVEQSVEHLSNCFSYQLHIYYFCKKVVVVRSCQYSEDTQYCFIVSEPDSSE